MSALVAKARCWSVADGSRLVPEGDPDAAFLVANRDGFRVSDEDLKMFDNVDEFFEPANDVPAPTPPRQIMPISEVRQRKEKNRVVSPTAKPAKRKRPSTAPEQAPKEDTRSPREQLMALSDEDLAKNCQEYKVDPTGLDRKGIVDALLKTAGYSEPTE